VASLNQEREAMAKERDGARAETAQVIAQRDQLLKQKDQQIAEVTKQTQERLTQLASFQTQTEGTVAQIQTSSNTTLTQSQQQNEQLATQLTQATATIKEQQNTIARLQERLGGIRVNPNEATVQKPDGKIVRLPGNNLAVINLGLGDQIVQGMTFEVYDKHQGVPALGADGAREGEMPEGKASIEVIRILPGYSECRVIRRKPGYGINIGDLIANLVYDSTQKYNFVVYGDFDLNGDGRAESADADVIKRLITMWGGKVTNEVNINTDFIVMGVEPKADPPSPNDDAVQRQQKLEAQQAQEAYLNVLKQSSQLNIPIMNQNRFLNFVGYKSQAAR
jgi:hypothetical protein